MARVPLNGGLVMVPRELSAESSEEDWRAIEAYIQVASMLSLEKETEKAGEKAAETLLQSMLELRHI